MWFPAAPEWPLKSPWDCVPLDSPANGRLSGGFFFFFLFQLLVLHQILWAFDFLLDLEGWLHVSRKAWVPTCLVLLAFPDLSVLSWPSPLSLLLPTLVHGETRASFSLCLGFNLTSAKHNSKWFIMTEFFTFLQWNNWMSHFPLSS